jgi:regulator of sirC expression with transglutaminase-like and TPR domain
LNPAIHAAPPAPEELSALLRLLDDDTPAVRARVIERLSLCGGDISEWFATQPQKLDPLEKELLVTTLRISRRENLIREWIVPTGGAAAIAEDWETLEALLRTLSDFLHDGISLRQPLGDALDLLSEEAEEAGITNAKALRKFLFDGSRLRGNKINYYDHRNSDLAWAIAEGHSNPIGLCLIFILVARRLDFEVEGVNFPGHFMCRIYEEGYPLIIDCFDNGQLHVEFTLLESPQLTKQQRQILRQSADPGTILLRLLANLVQAFQEEARDEDTRLIEQLQKTLA